MNKEKTIDTIIAFWVELGLTLFICLLLILYLRPHLKRILGDLCGTEDRAQFWTVFSNILLVGWPAIIALSYHPNALAGDNQFFEIATRLGGNLGIFLVALVGIGIIVTFFALVAPRPPKPETK